jgi:hypothetical protein
LDDVTAFTPPSGSSQCNSASFCPERSLRLPRRFDRAIVDCRFYGSTLSCSFAKPGVEASGRSP